MHSHSMSGVDAFTAPLRRLLLLLFLFITSLFLARPEAIAHAFAEGDKASSRKAPASCCSPSATWAPKT